MEGPHHLMVFMGKDMAVPDIAPWTVKCCLYPANLSGRDYEGVFPPGLLRHTGQNRSIYQICYGKSSTEGAVVLHLRFWSNKNITFLPTQDLKRHQV